MGKRIKRCVFLFLGVLVFMASAGLVFPERLAMLTGSENVVSEKVLIPGGQSVGIQMKVKGALIVGVENQSGPKIGDMIVAVNEKEVSGPEDIHRILEESGTISKLAESEKSDKTRKTGKVKEVEITVVRDKKRISYPITPYFDEESGEYKLGFWIKERIAGIGTLTFYDPKTNYFASLGHGIYEAETGALLTAEKGNLLHTRVNRIKAGEKGTPGEIGGTVYDFENPMGSIETNTEFGVYGRADNSQDFDLTSPMVMAQKEDVKEGEAYILTTISGVKAEKFDIRITRVRRQSFESGKGLEFEVTDKRLIKECGGIIQGMSGSPIIQNNRIVGAVTHVFVNNPQKGYGIFAQWMAEEAEKTAEKP